MRSGTQLSQFLRVVLPTLFVYVLDIFYIRFKELPNTSKIAV